MSSTKRRRLSIRALPPAILIVLACVPGIGSGPTVSGRTAHVATSPAITESDLLHRLSLIADDSMEGRFTGSEGHRKTTEYLARELRRLGLQPAGERGSYFQQVPRIVRRRALDHRLVAGDEPLVPLRDFVAIHPGGRILSFDGAEVIYGGILEDTARRITAEQARGRFVILIYGNTRNTAGNIRTAQFDPRLSTAVAVATMNPDQAMANWAVHVTSEAATNVADDDPERPTPAALAISARAAALLLGRAADSTVPLGTIGTRVRGATPFRTDTLAVRNVVAVLPGADPMRAGEYVALGAHSDHVPLSRIVFDHDSMRVMNTLVEARERELGVTFLGAADRAAIRVNTDSLRALRPARRDSIHNGADDDGSGTVALLEVAEALATARRRPARSILFVWHAAEEMGLLGSRHFTDHPTVPRESIIAQLNLDMVGRGSAADVAGGGPEHLGLVGWRRLSNELGDVMEEVNRRSATPFRFDVQYDAPGHPEQRYCRSDHFSYARYAIPVAFLSTGLHVDYHQVTDEVEYIDLGKLRRVSTFVRDVAVALAMRERRPVVDGPVQDPRAACVQ